MLSALHIVSSDARADLVVMIMGHEMKGALEFHDDCVRVSLELPWILAMMAEKAKGINNAAYRRNAAAAAAQRVILAANSRPDAA